MDSVIYGIILLALNVLYLDILVYIFPEDLNFKYESIC